jgi:thioredoxin 1
MELLSKKMFIEKIYDYENKKEWEYHGELPAIVDFYADWCGPCKMVAPILEKLASEFQGKIDIYKVNTDQEQELATAFGIMTIPSLMFIPKQGQPQMARGALSHEAFVKMINEVLGVK